MVSDLNKEFQELVQSSYTISQAYNQLVASHPYRLLALFEYTQEEESMRSTRNSQTAKSVWLLIN